MLLQKLEAVLLERMGQWAQKHDIEIPRKIALSAPPSHVAADVSVSWPLQAAKQAGKKPLETARELADTIRDEKLLSLIDHTPPGFLNIRFRTTDLAQNLENILSEPHSYGQIPAKPGQTILMEFVSANPTGPLHLASGRAATLGDSLTRILRRIGYTVKTEYYVNDVGRQVKLLGESLGARFFQARGQAAPIPEGGYFGEYLGEMARGISSAENWAAEDFQEHAVKNLLDMHRKDMESFGVKFDRWFRETEIHKSNALDKALKTLKERKMVYEKEGAVWFGSSDSEHVKDDKDRVLIRNDKNPTYFLADIAYHKNKMERGFTTLIDIWGADHHGYVPRMKAAMAALGYPEDSLRIILHQFVHLYRGKESVRMSKRAGEFVTLKEVIDEVGRDACRFFFAMRSPNSHLNFDLELAKKQSKENPVYYVQYVHARICSIFREAEKKKMMRDAGKCGLLKEPEERALLVKIAWFPEILKACERDMSPHHLTTYLMELGGVFHPFYETHRVVNEEAPELTAARLALCDGVRHVISSGLDLLGISAPTKM